jgi:hypothetical protein
MIRCNNPQRNSSETLTDHERHELAEFLNSPTALFEVKTHLPFEFVMLAADALQRAGLD